MPYPIASSSTDWWVVAVTIPIGVAFLISFLRWLLTPPTWRDGEGPLINEGEHVATKFSYVRWFVDIVTLKWWRW